MDNWPGSKMGRTGAAVRLSREKGGGKKKPGVGEKGNPRDIYIYTYIHIYIYTVVGKVTVIKLLRYVTSYFFI
jgi:hypothetical protein